MTDIARKSRSVSRGVGLLLCLTLALAGCGGGDDGNSSASTSPGSVTSPEPQNPIPSVPDTQPDDQPAPADTVPDSDPNNSAPNDSPPYGAPPIGSAPSEPPSTESPSNGSSPADSPSDSAPQAPSTPPPEATEPEPEPESPPTANNAAPTITGVAATSVNVNSLYTFTPAASDPDGDMLAFEIENKPSWATFSTVNGRLTGTPRAEHEGTYPNIVIRVSDGNTSVSLPPFTITVVPAESANGATLSWIAPTENEDGSVLVDLAGYTIVYGPSREMLHNSIRIDNPGIDRYVFDDLPAGTYYFGVKAFNAQGVESAVSNIVSKVIQ
jgi:Predicted membrane protein